MRQFVNNLITSVSEGILAISLLIALFMIQGGRVVACAVPDWGS